jgi:hypothetical protein
MPDAGEALERIENVAAMVVTHFADDRFVAAMAELVCLERMVEAPLSLKAVEGGAIYDPHAGANGKLLSVWLRHQRTPSSAERCVHLQAIS